MKHFKCIKMCLGGLTVALSVAYIQYMLQIKLTEKVILYM